MPKEKCNKWKRESKDCTLFHICAALSCRRRVTLITPDGMGYDEWALHDQGPEGTGMIGVQAIFLLSVAFALYAVVGYPALLAVLARIRPRPVRKSFLARRITVLLPVRNGSRWIAAKLESLLTQRYAPELVDILVISDGSTDDTDEIVQNFASSGRVRLLRVPSGGKALAINAGIAEARGDLLFFTDIRQIITPDSLRNLVSCLGDPEVGAVSGEIVIRQGETLEEMSIGAYWKYEKWIRKHQS